MLYRLSLSHLWDEYQASIVLVAAALGLALAQLQPPATATVEARIPSAPIVVIATATPGPVLSIAATQPLRLPAPVVAYAAPDGTVLGPIEAGRVYTPTARLGDAWTLIRAAESGHVWVRAVELAPLAALPDLAPTAAPQIIYVAAAPEPPSAPPAQPELPKAEAAPVAAEQPFEPPVDMRTQRGGPRPQMHGSGPGVQFAAP